MTPSGCALTLHARQQCVAFEDSLSGVHASKAAGTTVIAVPGPEDAMDPGFDAADLVLTALNDFSLDLLPLE